VGNYFIKETYQDNGRWKSYIIFIVKFQSAWEFAFHSLLWRAIKLEQNPNLVPAQFGLVSLKNNKKRLKQFAPI